MLKLAVVAAPALTVPALKLAAVVVPNVLEPALIVPALKVAAEAWPVVKDVELTFAAEI